MSDKNYYETLGLTKEADEAVIKAAYKALAQKYHPDKQDSSSQRESTRLMSEINKAYSVLGDIDKRKEYDNKQVNNQLKKLLRTKRSLPNLRKNKKQKKLPILKTQIY
jgi:DnaJ-class molecular chaperone